MLGKLIKHEFKATYKVYLPLFLTTLILVVFSKTSMLLTDVFKTSTIATSIFNFISVAAMFFTILFMVAVIFVVYIFSIVRFYKNLLGDEGYIMFTLPVKPYQHILTRIFVSVIWMFGAVFVDLLSLDILTLSKGRGSIFTLISTIAKMANEQIGINLYAVIGMLFLIFIFGFIFSFSEMFLCISIGSHWTTNRLLFSFVAYIAVSFIKQILSFIVLGITVLIFNQNNITKFLDTLTITNPTLLMISIMAIGCSLCAIGSVIYFFITKHLLTKKLNLA